MDRLATAKSLHLHEVEIKPAMVVEGMAVSRTEKRKKRMMTFITAGIQLFRMIPRMLSTLGIVALEEEVAEAVVEVVLGTHPRTCP